MARVAFATRVVDEAGNAVGGSTYQARVYDDFGTSVATVVTDDTGGGTTIAQPITPNAGTQTTLTVTTGTGDTTITVASTTGFAVGQLIPIYDGTNTVYRFIRTILSGPPRLTLNAAVGFVFSSSNTTVGNLDMIGVVAGWVPDTAYHYLQVKETASGRVMPPTLIPTMIGNSSVAVLEEGAATGTRPTINFKGTAITAVDNAPSTRVDVTVAGDFTDQTFLKIGTNPAASGVVRLPNNNAVTWRNAANSGDIAGINVDGSNDIVVAPAARFLVAGNLPAIAIGTTSPAATTGILRMPNAATIFTRNAGDTANEEWTRIWAATKSADENVNNSTTLQNDDHLLFAVGANERWAFEMFLYVVLFTAAGFKFTFTVPASATGAYGGDSIGGATGGVINAANVEHIQSDTITATLGSVSGSFNQAMTMIRLSGLILTAGTAGTVQFQWAQNAATVGNTTVKQGSWLRASRV